MTDRAQSAKIVIIGDYAVGKTSLATRFVNDVFTFDTQTTIGTMFLSKRLEIDNQTCVVQIWDSQGQERFRTRGNTNYRHAEAVIICYDISSPENVENIRNWVSETKRYTHDDIILFLVGTKADLISDTSEVFRIVDQYANEINATCTLTSAKENFGIEDTFVRLARQVLEQRALKDPQSIVNLAKEKQKRKGRC